MSAYCDEGTWKKPQARMHTWTITIDHYVAWDQVPIHPPLVMVRIWRRDWNFQAQIEVHDVDA